MSAAASIALSAFVAASCAACLAASFSSFVAFGVPSIAANLTFLALSISNLAWAFWSNKVWALISAWFLRFAIATLFVSSFKIAWALAISAWYAAHASGV